MPAKRSVWVVAIEAYVGDDTAISIEGDQEGGRLYAVVQTSPEGAAILDNGYRTRAEAKRSWPEAN